MITRSAYGAPLYGATFLPTIAALLAMAVTDHVPYEVVQVADGRIVYYHPTSTLTADSIFVFAPGGSQAGRWLLAPGANRVDLPLSKDTADAATLATLPTGCYFLNQRGFWEVTTSFTGGSASAIGISSDDATCNTKGDLLGGAAGDVAAMLVSTGALYKAGTVGAKTVSIVAPGKILRHDRVTSAFTAGVGVAHLQGVILANPGA